MKTMKLWRIAFMMLAAFSLASCKPSPSPLASRRLPCRWLARGDDNEEKVEQVTVNVSA